jgi:colanic acid/amylovoran biosynthesis glycosyltransferase
MTKIGFLIPEFPGQTHAFFMRESDELKKLGIETTLISTKPPTKGESTSVHQWTESATEKTHYLFPFSLHRFLTAFKQILLAGPFSWSKCFKSIFGPSDISISERFKLLPFVLVGAHLKNYCQRHQLTHVHVHSCANAANVAMFSRLLGGPSYSLTLHGPMHDYGKNHAQKWKNASFCIVITNELMDEVKTNLRGEPLPPIFIAPMGVNINIFQRDKSYIPANMGDQIRLVSCGRLHFVKAHDDLIRVVALLKDKGISAILNICGTKDSSDKDNQYTDELFDLPAKLGVKDQVNFLGSISETRVKDELQSAHFFCLGSLKEPLGVAIMEAMATETPAIVTRSPGTAEMIESGDNGILVAPRAPGEFVKVIEHLLQMPDKAIFLSKAGRKTVEERFHSGVSAAKIAEGVMLSNEKT